MISFQENLGYKIDLFVPEKGQGTQKAFTSACEMK